MNTMQIPKAILKGQFRNLFKHVQADYDDTIGAQFFKEVDKLVGTVRWVSNLRKSQRGMFVEYQNIVDTNVVKKLLANAWKMTDLIGPIQQLSNRDGWIVEVENVDTGSSLLVTRVTLIDQTPQGT